MDVWYRLRIPLVLIGLLLLSQPVRAWFAPPALARPANQQAPTNLIAVTTTADDFTPANGTCSLREAVYAAVRDIAVDACAAGSLADTVALPAGTYSLTRTGTFEDAGLTGDLDITGTLQLTGATSATTILDGGDHDRLFEVFAGTVGLSNLTLRNGRGFFYGGAVWLRGGALTVAGSTLESNTATWVDIDSNDQSNYGGAIAAQTGALTVTGSLLRSNSAAGIYQGPSGFGGAIYAGAGVRATILNSAILDGSASSGGAVYNAGNLVIRGGLLAGNEGPIFNKGTALIERSRLLDNEAPMVHNDSGRALTVKQSELAGATISRFNFGCTNGGAIANYGNLTLDQSYLHDNDGHSGGALASFAGRVAVVDSALIGNSAFNESVSREDCNGLGGGIYAYNTLLTVDNSTLGANWAEYHGGGLYSLQSSGRILNSTIASNTIDLEPLYDTGEDVFGGAGVTLYNSTTVFSLTSTLLAGNTSLVAPTASDCHGTLLSGGYNLIAAPAPGCVITGTQTGNLIGVDPLLEPLGDNGGPTLTYAIAAQSPAIDAGAPSGCPAADQRGFHRPADGDGSDGPRCDIGAYERQPAGAEPTVTPLPTVTPPATVTPGPCPIATPEPLWVQPVQSPTNALTQTIEIYAGRAVTVTVDSEAGRVTQVGGQTWPARMTINLLPGTTHHLTVKSHVARSVVNGCVYGGYTLQTTRDRYGALLTIVQTGEPVATPTATPIATVTPTTTPTTPTPCPMATPQPLWVQPVQSPTNALTQTIEIYAGGAMTVTVDSEAGRVTQVGGQTWPARITINLLPGTTHHLTVRSEVARSVVNGCVYGGYTLQTTRDRYGALLTIVQGGAVTATPTTIVPTETSPGSDPDPLYLPLVVR